jgi:hypothetical protein
MYLGTFSLHAAPDGAGMCGVRASYKHLAPPEQTCCSSEARTFTSRRCPFVQRLCVTSCRRRVCLAEEPLFRRSFT